MEYGASSASCTSTPRPKWCSTYSPTLSTSGTGGARRATSRRPPAGDGTTLRFRESGYRERGWEAAVLEAHYNDHRQGWDFHLPCLAATARQAAGAR